MCQGEQIIDHSAHSLCFCSRIVQGGFRVFRCDAGCFGEQIEIAANGADRGAQFMRSIGHEALLALVGFFEVCQHEIKSSGKASQFVPSTGCLFGNTLTEIVRIADALSRCRDSPDGDEQASRQEPATKQGKHHYQSPTAPLKCAQVSKRLFNILLGARSLDNVIEAILVINYCVNTNVLALIKNSTEHVARFAGIASRMS